MGWSVGNDVPRRLSWADLWATFKALCADPGSNTAASLGNMDYPADRLTLAVQAALGVPGPFNKIRKPKQADVHAATQHMSSRFAKLYHH